MAPLSLKVVQDNGAVTRTVKVESKASVENALQTVLEKFMIPDDGKAYGLFLTSADDDRSGVWLESFRNVEYYMLRDGDTLLLLCKTRNLRLRMLDGSVKTLLVDESQPISQMMIGICARIGITNHDEYGLCYDNNDEDTESKVTSTGTLTLKRAPHQREKDAKLEHMSKKLKTDDNVQWLDMHRTLREMEVGLGDTLLLKRRLFYTDRNVDARDPVQLNLLYVQTRDAILCGRHPVTVDQACEFAGIQCQIQYGDYQEDKHKAGFFELKELLPDSVSNKSGVEKKIIKEYKKHQGLSNVDAKHLYTKTARDMPTYGVTFFVVKEKQQKGKKKLVPRLLGISASAILRLDEETKEILQAWPLTQVMSYQVGKSHTFTLNFGDYSDKEYSVKTNDAVRIRDILQGYIDIIARRMAGGHNSSMNDGASVMEDSVQMSKGTTMQFVKNNPNKIVEESFVGPTKIISYEPGQTVSQGTQVLTAQQLIITSQANKQQYQTSGEVPLRKEMSLEFVRKLNRMNSNSVKVVNLITSDDGPHNAELKNIVNTMENDMPLIAAGVNEILKKDMDADAKKRLQDELQELNEYLKTLMHNVYGPDPGSDESLEAASRIADVSTQMYLGLDPLTKRRSNLVRLSRQSFIEDEKVQANLHRASFISAAAGACSAVDNASLLINQEYTGPALSASQIEELERNARDKMRKLNGAVALFLTAHADPDNIDYSAAVTSMNTINELMLELAKDGQALASTKDGASKQELIDDINKLCDATRLVCSLTGTGDHQKMQDVTSVYGPVADKLIFTFGRGRRDDKDNRIINLAKNAGEKTSLLLIKATEVTGLVPSSAAAQELDDAGVQCAGAASDLLACAMLTSPCIYEPHCQSALTASAETLSTAAQRVLAAAKPLVEEPAMKHHGDDLRDRSLELARALDALKNAYGNEEQMAAEESAAKERHRLRFVMRLADACKGLDDALKELNKPPIAARHDQSPVVVAMLEKNLAQRMAEYNSAVAALLVATSDRDNPDYKAAETALNTINELMPGIVKDTKTLAASRDKATRDAMLEDLKQLCEATRGICASAGKGNIDDLNESAASLANTSNKLYFTFNPAAPADNEQQILDIATAACTKASQMLANVYQLAEQTGGAAGERLDAGGARTADGAKALLTCAQLTAACIDNPACQASLLQAADALCASSSQVADSCADMNSPLADKLRGEQKELEAELDKLRRACRSCKGQGADDGSSKLREMQRLQFVKSMSAAKAGLQDIRDELAKPYDDAVPTGEASVMRQHHLSQSLARLNAALAALTAATADPVNPDYEAANAALATINEAMPLVVRETKAMASSRDEGEQKALLEELQKLCDATRGVCDTVHQDPDKLREFTKEFSAASGKLVFVFNPRADPQAANQVMKQAYEACTTADQIVRDSNKLADQLPASDVAADKLRLHADETRIAADSLMTSAQLTAASMDDPHCQSALLSSVDALSSSAHHLAQQWASPRADELVKNLDKEHQSLQRQLEAMRRQYSKKPSSGRTSADESRRQQLVKAAAAAKRSLADIHKDGIFSVPYNETLPSGEAALIRQHQLSQSLARLNAALAALAATTADPDNPDYAAANEAMAVISETMPHVVKETKVMASMKPANEREAMLQQLQKLCDATRGVCDTAHHDPDKLREFAKEFGKASGKLVFVLNPNQRTRESDQVMQQANAACKAADQLVVDACKLAEQLPAAGLRREAEHTARAADTMLTSAQLTASSINDPQCQAALSSSVKALSSSAQHLAQQWAPLHGKADEAVIQKLDAGHRDLQQKLDTVRSEFCKKPSRVMRTAEEERQWRQFAKSAAAAQKGLMDIDKELTKPYSCVPARAAACGPQLRDAMARLNAALAALTAATLDPENPDYVAADEAMATITELMPLVVKDTKAMASTKDDKTREEMMTELRALCDATRDICDAQQDPRQLREPAKKFSAASSKLEYVIKPSLTPAHIEQVMRQANCACNSAEQLASESCNLAVRLPAGAGQKIRQAAGNTLEAAVALRTVTQLTAPTLEDPRCQSIVLSSVDNLSLSAHHLSQQWAPVHDKDEQGVVKKLDKHHGELQLLLENMRKECQGDESDLRPESKEQRRVRFADFVAATKSELDSIEEELSKPYTGTLPKGEAKAIRQLNLSNSLAKLNAALAALAAATADLENPDYAAADEAMSTIHETLPLVVKDTKAMAAVQDDISREAMLGAARALCAAARGVCGAAQRDHKALRDFAKNFAAASGKLVYVVNARAKPTTANQVMEATQAACKTTNQLVKNSFRLAEQLSASDVTGFKIRNSGGKTLDAADTLMTAAQLTAPCISDPQCQSSLAASIANLSSSAQELGRHWSPLLQEPLLTPVIRELEKEHQKLADELDHLRSFCQDSNKGKDDKVDEQRIKETQKNQYIAKAAAAQEAMRVAEKELDKPVPEAPASGEAAAAQQLQLSQRLAKLHAALLALSIATSDNNNPDYVTAEKSIDTVRELMPHVVKNTAALLAGKDSASREATAAELRALCRGATDMCGSATQQDSAKLNDQLTKNVIPRLGKLYYVVHPNVGTNKLAKVETCAKASGSKASQLLTNVFQLAEAAPGEVGAELDSKGAATADAAKALLTAVQLTGPYIHEPEAQSTLISVADTLSSSARDIASVWHPLTQDPKHKAACERLAKDLEELDAELQKFKNACKEPGPENIVHKTTSKPKPLPPPRKPDDEEIKKKQFTTALEKVTHGLQNAEEDIKRIYNAKLDEPRMHKDQVRGVQKALERKIALSNVATSALLACNASEPMDYAAAAKHSTELANLVPKIAQDAKVLSNTLSEQEKKSFLDDILAMFDSTRKVIEAAQNDRKSLNGVAVEYGNKSGALLYTVCTDFDPSHEKEVISRAKDIGDSVSKITLCSAQLMSDASADKTSELCAAGKACAGAAGSLVYTAKLVAPSIQVAECQDILKSASETLSTKIKTFSTAWQPLAADPEKKACIDELNSKTAKAEGLLEELRKDLESGKLVKMRPQEQLVIEDTPLRKLTAALIENAMKKASNPSLPLDQKRALVEYARALTDASAQLDRANAVCKKEPHNLEKSRELEDAVQSLQVLALQSRPSLGAPQQQYIVDLTEYVKELSQEANGMISAIDSCSVKHKEINTTCQKITADADRILHPPDGYNVGDGTTVDDIYEVDRFGRTTDDRVKKIASQIQVLPECKDKTVLNTQSVNLEDSCNILRFATQSAVATTQSASLDETLQDLIDLEKRIDTMLQAGDKPGRCVDEPIPWAVRSSLLQATRGIASQPQLCTALTQYVDEQRARTDAADPEANHRLKEHLRKLTHLLRVLVLQTGRRAATWQALDGPEVTSVMEQVLKEIDAGCSFNQPKSQGRSVLQNIDLNRLLLSTDVIQIEGDRKHIEDKMQQTATKLTSMLSTVMASSAKPESMVRSLTVTADTAGELAALARALKKPDDPVYNAKIEEAVREATFQTYNVLIASELVSQEPNNPAYRRRLLDACRMLNDALNSLGRTTSPEGRKMQRECSELARNLQLQQTLLQSTQPTCALPYADCLDALQNQQEVIQKLNSDQTMSRGEFCRALGYISSAVCNSTELAAQCGYLMSISERDHEATKTGVVDVQQLKKVTEDALATCYRMLQFDAEQAKEEAVHLTKKTEELRGALLDAEKKSQHFKEELSTAAGKLDQRTRELNSALAAPADIAKITAATTQLLESIKTVTALTEHPSLVPVAGNVSAEARERADHVITAARDLCTKTASLVRDVKTRAAHGNDDDNEPMTWVTFNLKRKDVVKAFEALLASVRENGQRAGILEVEQQEVEEEAPKSFIQIQVDLANKWLKRPHCKPEVKASGEDAARKVIDIAEKMVVDMKESEKEDMNALITETKELLGECSKKCTPDKASLLVERLKALKKAIERGVITMVVEDLIEGEEPLQDLEILAESESDESKRKFLLERKIAELLAQLARVSRTARAVAHTQAGGQKNNVELNKCTEQANLLAPLLVKAAQERINTPDNKAAIENYKSLLAQYAESMSKVRDLCDQSVDPMEFVQTAGETMQRMREESSHDNDPQKCVYTSTAITKLANRVIQVSMSSNNAKEDPELRKALAEAQQRLQAAVPGPQTRKSSMPDWKDTTAEILRTTGRVEAVMGGEMIFQNQPQSDQPIFAAARDLHTAVREWSARDNEIVAVAKRMAVLMAKLSAYMNTNKKHELLVTSKSIVSNSHEVAELARKLAHECTDMRIKTNLLQVCDRIPTISGQLKMLTTVKGATLSRQGNKEDQESLNMLVDNAQNLMLSIQEVVKVSAGASVKILSQRGGLRVRWVRRHYYY